MAVRRGFMRRGRELSGSTGWGQIWSGRGSHLTLPECGARMDIWSTVWSWSVRRLYLVIPEHDGAAGAHRIGGERFDGGP